jgi:hypothetical protein
MANFQELLSEAYQLLDTARMLNASDRNGLEFVNTQLELSRAFAERALAVFSAGDVDKAKQSALAAKAAYRSVQKSLSKLLVAQRESIAMKLGNLTPLIEKLSAIS